VRVYTEAPPEMIEDRTILLAPLLCRSFTSVESILRKYSKRQTKPTIHLGDDTSKQVA